MFYFVLDEVGGSSDIESGTVSDNETNPSSERGRWTETVVRGNGSPQTQLLLRDDREQEGKDVSVPADAVHGAALINSNDHGNEEINVGGSSSDSRDLVSLSGTRNADSGTHPEQDTGAGIMDMDCESDGESVSGIRNEAIKPIIKISFRDEKIENSYKSSIIKYLSQKIHPCTIVTSSENSLEVEVYKEETEKVLDDDVLDFHLDTTPTSDYQTTRVPSYGRNHDVLLGDSDSVEAATVKNDVGGTCFNCCGNHTLRDCPYEKQMKVINRNRNKFLGQNKLPKSRRYHLDENQRFGNLVPGNLSKKLRNALGLRKEQQPMFIYKMRLLGYPPAWLEEARVSHSGVIIYDSKGVPILEEDEEEGEIVAEGAKDRFDINKIIEFPGFNVPLQNDMREEGNMYGCPAMAEEQSKESLIRTLQPNAVQAYKKKSLTLQKYSSEKEPPTETTAGKRLSSPTIEEMEEKKRQLLLALNDEEGTPDNKVTQNESDTPSKEPADSGTQEMPIGEVKAIKSMHFGTPILKSISPFSKLPSREQFSTNMSDILNFENLPNSTGKYETMSTLIMKIRDTVSKIQNE